MSQQKLPRDFVKRCKSVTAKRPKTVIDHILKHGFITTEQLKDEYGYHHPPRAVRDVKEHGIPIEMFRVAGGDGRDAEQKPADYMLLCGSANRAKSWSCEHCVNWLELKKPEVCRTCYWAFPDNYTHIAMRQVRRADIIWTEQEVELYEKLKRRTIELQQNIPDYVKEIIRNYIS